MSIIERINKLDSTGMRRIVGSINPKAKKLEDLDAGDRGFVERYLDAVDALDLPDRLLVLLPDVLEASRIAVGKWPRISILRKRLESEFNVQYAEAMYAWQDEAYGW